MSTVLFLVVSLTHGKSYTRMRNNLENGYLLILLFWAWQVALRLPLEFTTSLGCRPWLCTQLWHLEPSFTYKPSITLSIMVSQEKSYQMASMRRWLFCTVGTLLIAFRIIFYSNCNGIPTITRTPQSHSKRCYRWINLLSCLTDTIWWFWCPSSPK